MTKIKPILKWAGGKRQLIPHINQKIEKIKGNYKTYYEPFFGGGAVLFELLPQRAIISDVNWELYNLYCQIKDNPSKVIENLLEMEKNDCNEYYYKIRGYDRESNWDTISEAFKAARTIYLNKTCYNGLFRVNKSGKFNVPYGRNKKKFDLDCDNIIRISEYFNKKNIKILNSDFEIACKNIRKGSLVYFDPPYDQISKTSNFTGYTEFGFTQFDQERLKQLMDKLTNRGVYVLLSNSDTKNIRNLYKKYKPFTKIVQANRTINSNTSKRGYVNEVLIDNFKKVDQILNKKT